MRNDYVMTSVKGRFDAREIGFEINYRYEDFVRKSKAAKKETVEDFIKRGGTITKFHNTSYNYYRLNRYSVLY